MFCKKCGNKIESNSRFCSSCGSEVHLKKLKEQNTSEDYFYHEDYQEEMPEYINSVESDKYININKPPKNLKRLLIFIGVCTVFLVVVLIISGGSKPIYDIQLGVEIDSESLYPVNQYEIFNESSGYIYASYKTQDLDIGQTFKVKWYNKMSSPHTLICSETITNNFEEQIGYSSCDYDWMYGAYKIDFIVNDKIVATKEFDVE